MALENRILPESKSPLPLAELGCFSKGEDEGSGILVAGKLLSIAREEGSSLNSSCRKNYLRETDKGKTESDSGIFKLSKTNSMLSGLLLFHYNVQDAM